MSNRLSFEGLSVSPNVVETIARIATEEVEGVACVGGVPVTGAAALLKPKIPGVEISLGDGDLLLVAVYVTALYGVKLPALGARIQEAIADALGLQLGTKAVQVDVYIEALEFEACAH